MALCFSYFSVKVLKDFCVMTVARDGSRLVLLRAMATGKPTSLTNAAIVIPSVTTVDVIRPVFTMPVIALNRLEIRSRTSFLSSKYASILVNFLK